MLHLAKCLHSIAPIFGLLSPCLIGVANRAPASELFVESKLTAPSPGPDEFFGSSVAVSGQMAIIGARGDDMAGLRDSGAAYIYNMDNQGRWHESATLTPSMPAGGVNFGHTVSINGDMAIVGTIRDGVVSGSGAAYIYKHDGAGNWNEIAKLISSDRSANDTFGWTVAISGKNAIVGAPGADVDGRHDAGAAYVFSDNGHGVWEQIAKLTASDAMADDAFGYFKPPAHPSENVAAVNCFTLVGSASSS